MLDTASEGVDARDVRVRKPPEHIAGGQALERADLECLCTLAFERGHHRLPRPDVAGEPVLGESASFDDLAQEALTELVVFLRFLGALQCRPDRGLRSGHRPTHCAESAAE